MAGGATAEGGTAFFSAGGTLTYERATATLSGSELTVKSLKLSAHEDVAQGAAARALTAPCTYEVDVIATRK